MSNVWDNHLEDSSSLLSFHNKTIWDGTIRVMKIMQKNRFQLSIVSIGYCS